MIEAVAVAREPIAVDVVRIELAAVDGRPLPSFGAGDHVDLTLSPTLVRSYSLIDPPAESPGRYRIAVALNPASRGGSRRVHELVAGDRLTISEPLPEFPLAEDAAHTVLIAGGIGITPLAAMAARLTELGRSWELHYAFRARAAAALVAELERLGAQAGADVRLYDDERDGPLTLPLAKVVASAAPDAHLYCCGPAPMLDAYLRATDGLAAERVHLERFRGDAEMLAGAGPDADRPFTVELVRCGREFTIGAEETILDTLLDAGIDVAFSCMEGICGSCRVDVLEGIPDHRDSVLSDAERQAGDVVMICSSRAKGDRLVLDL